MTGEFIEGEFHFPVCACEINRFSFGLERDFFRCFIHGDGITCIVKRQEFFHHFHLTVGPFVLPVGEFDPPFSAQDGIGIECVKDQAVFFFLFQSE